MNLLFSSRVAEILSYRACEAAATAAPPCSENRAEEPTGRRFAATLPHVAAGFPT